MAMLLRLEGEVVPEVVVELVNRVGAPPLLFGEGGH